MSLYAAAHLERTYRLSKLPGALQLGTVGADYSDGACFQSHDVGAGHVQEMSDEQLLESNGIRACSDAGEFSVRL